MGLRFTGERVIPELPEMRVTFVQSCAAYEYAARSVAGKRVLDIGAGEGYGPALLARPAALTIGLDRDPEAVRWAATKYGAVDHLAFVVGAAEAIPLRTGSIDVVTCFQVIEHLRDPHAYLRDVARTLTPGGALFLTTPNRLKVGERPNPHHVHDFAPAELARLLRDVFAEVELYGVFAGPAVAAYRERNDRVVRGLLRLDPLGILDRLPERLLQPAHVMLTLMIRRTVNARSRTLLTDLTTADFPIRAEPIDEAVDLLAVCRVSATADNDRY